MRVNELRFSCSMYQNQSYIFSYHIQHRIRRDTIVCAKLNIKSYIDFKDRCRWLCLWKNLHVNAFSSRSAYLFPQWKEVDGLYSRLGVLWKSNLLISSAKIVDLLVYNECKTERSRLKVLSYITRYITVEYVGYPNSVKRFFSSSG